MIKEEMLQGKPPPLEQVRVKSQSAMTTEKALVSKKTPEIWSERGFCHQRAIPPKMREGMLSSCLKLFNGFL